MGKEKMTEAEWLSADDPGFMLDEVEDQVSDRTPEAAG